MVTAERGVIAVENPATGAVVGHAEEMDAAQVEALIGRARTAQPAWKALGFARRARLMRDLRAWIVDNRTRIIDVVTQENGKTHEDALLAEIFYVCQALGFWARHSQRLLRDERVRAGSPLLLGRRLRVRYEPYGVVGVIAPWNYPLALGIGDTIPALMAGNAVVLKPSELTPLSTKLIVEQGMRVVGFPDDVCLVATGASSTGAAVVDGADMIMFTGSTATGKKIMARAAERLVPVSAELGGKDPMIVCADADLDRAANCAVFWGLANSGQTCMSVERIYVEQPVYHEFVAKVVERVQSLRQGPPGAPGTVDVGAITSPAQIDIVERHVEDAVARGARVLCGGRRGDGDGRFYEPTVLVDVDHSMACMREETFGPTLPIVSVRDAEEAIRLANDSPYGLNASVFTRDLHRGRQIARRLQTGSCNVNDAVMNYVAIAAPFAGWKQSGLGSRHGAAGIRKYCKPQTVLVNRLRLKRDPIMYPNRSRETRLFHRLIVLLYGRRPWARRATARSCSRF